jgi:hypothetical protein
MTKRLGMENLFHGQLLTLRNFDLVFLYVLYVFWRPGIGNGYRILTMKRIASRIWPFSNGICEYSHYGSRFSRDGSQIIHTMRPDRIKTQ